MIAIDGANRLVEGAKPCPFCGGTNIRVTEREFFDNIIAEQGHACIVAGCPDCTADVTHFGHDEEDVPDYDVRVRLVLAMWNRRADG